MIMIRDIDDTNSKTFKTIQNNQKILKDFFYWPTIKPSILIQDTIWCQYYTIVLDIHNAKTSGQINQ